MAIFRGQNNIFGQNFIVLEIQLLEPRWHPVRGRGAVFLVKTMVKHRLDTGEEEDIWAWQPMWACKSDNHIVTISCLEGPFSSSNSNIITTYSGGSSLCKNSKAIGGNLLVCVHMMSLGSV